MAFKTLDQIRSKIERDLDLEEEEFIQSQEMIEYINDAITRAEAHICKLGLRDKYFLTKTAINMVQGQADYELPENIYTNKILEVVYQNNDEIYKIDPIDSITMLADMLWMNNNSGGALYDYRYWIHHDSPGEERIQIVPVPRDSVTSGINIMHYRDANQLEEDDDICDLPEIALQYLYQYVKKMVYEKERGQSWEVAKQELMDIEKLMIETLSQQIADPAMSEVEKDLTTYWEHS